MVSFLGFQTPQINYDYLKDNYERIYYNPFKLMSTLKGIIKKQIITVTYPGGRGA